MEYVPLSGKPLSSTLLRADSAVREDENLVVNLEAGLRSSSLVDEVRRCELVDKSGVVRFSSSSRRFSAWGVKFVGFEEAREVLRGVRMAVGVVVAGLLNEVTLVRGCCCTEFLVEFCFAGVRESRDGVSGVSPGLESRLGPGIPESRRGLVGVGSRSALFRDARRVVGILDVRCGIRETLDVRARRPLVAEVIGIREASDIFGKRDEGNEA